eukprot:TRINITY_DN3234_c0_g1_i2.p1 TRINITY_DN3234_c0_g1~~TRINITY_DN3234_c0_g1_i2.p1  ORF type:complete len:489 (-),score=168.17 TRINITY_DN3234_c0_g1_i2:85-1551(-)
MPLELDEDFGGINLPGDHDQLVDFDEGFEQEDEETIVHEIEENDTGRFRFALNEQLEDFSDENISKELKNLPSKPKTSVFVPGKDQLPKEQPYLDYDPAYYDFYHRFNVGWPCLSFDILPDDKGAHRIEFPLEFYMVTGTQADGKSENSIIILEVSEILSTHPNEYEDLADNHDPSLKTLQIPVPGVVNRIRACPSKPSLIAAWITNTSGSNLAIWDISEHIDKLSEDNHLEEIPPIYVYESPVEGYALAWADENLLSGDCHGQIVLHTLTKDGFEAVQSYEGHSSSVEDICFSPSNNEFFASVGCDKAIVLWNLKSSQQTLSVRSEAHDGDINVFDWNSSIPNLIVTGGDDGIIKVWDLNDMTRPSFEFDFNEGHPITSIRWNPNDATCFAASSDNGTVTIWDIDLVENSDEQEQNEDEDEPIDTPPQLLFIHAGQTQIKEVAWHSQLVGCLVVTAYDGFNIIRPTNIMANYEAEADDEVVVEDMLS